MLNTDAIHIWREPDGDYHIEWEATHPDTKVVVEPLAEGGNLRAHYPASPHSSVRFSGLAPGARHYFRLRDQHGTQVTATERRLGMQGTPNFRDFGGYRTEAGRMVKWGYLFRSGQLSNLSEQDIGLLSSLNIDLVCDFRRVEEQQNDPSRLPLKRPRVASLPIIPGSNSSFLEQAGESWGGRQAMYDFMVDINRDFAEAQTATYARMFAEILALQDTRLLVHCAAGKDRTGFAAAIILLALGVPREVVMRDYLLTARFFDPQLELERIKKKYAMEQMDAESVMPMLEVHEAYLACALQAIDREYDSIEAYLAEQLGVGEPEVKELQRRYLD
tara:strand:- start:36726 stop:37721 length:996 start_codon:yes stop_codon:yes gene_type:complete